MDLKHNESFQVSPKVKHPINLEKSVAHWKSGESGQDYPLRCQEVEDEVLNSKANYKGIQILKSMFWGIRVSDKSTERFFAIRIIKSRRNADYATTKLPSTVLRLPARDLSLSTALDKLLWKLLLPVYPLWPTNSLYVINVIVLYW